MHRGQSLIEILFALALAMIAIGTIAYLLLGTQTASLQLAEYAEGAALATEGLAAVRSISQESFDNLSEGTHGLTLVDGVWQLSGNEDSLGQYTRQLTLTALDADNEIFEVTSLVSWPATQNRDASVSYSTFISNWRQRKGNATFLSFDTTALTYTNGGQTIDGVSVSNTHGSQDIVITELQIFWDGTAKLATTSIDNTVVFSTLPGAEASSGDTIDIIDTTILAGGTSAPFGPFEFTGVVNTTDVLMAVYLSDGTKYYVRATP